MPDWNKRPQVGIEASPANAFKYMLNHQLWNNTDVFS